MIPKDFKTDSVKNTTIIPNPSWGDTVKLLEEHNSIRIATSDAAQFKTILDASGYTYECSEDGELTRFTLIPTQTN